MNIETWNTGAGTNFWDGIKTRFYAVKDILSGKPFSLLSYDYKETTNAEEITEFEYSFRAVNVSGEILETATFSLLDFMDEYTEAGEQVNNMISDLDNE